MIAIPGYRLEAELGRGRCTRVYRAVELAHGRIVALKVARRAQLLHAQRGANFADEYATLHALTQRGAVGAFGHGTFAESAFLAMELAVPFQASEAFTLAFQAATALGHLHQQGWVHRDVKPAHLLRRRDGQVVWGDLGSACRQGTGGAQSNSASCKVVGTPRYAAPEQSTGATAQPTADVYSLGGVLYELLAARPLFPGETLTELFCQHQIAPVPLLPRTQQAWQPLLNAMLAKSPAQRPIDGHAVALAVAQLQARVSPGSTN